MGRTMTSLPEILLTALVSFGVGFILGQLVDFQRVGKKKIVPEVNWDHHGLLLKLVLVVLFVVSTSFLVNFTIQQRECNTEFQRTISERADSAVASDKALYDIVNGLLLINPADPTRREQTRHLLEEYQRTYQEKLDARNANPYPRC